MDKDADNALRRRFAMAPQPAADEGFVAGVRSVRTRAQRRQMLLNGVLGVLALFLFVAACRALLPLADYALRAVTVLTRGFEAGQDSLPVALVLLAVAACAGLCTWALRRD